MVSKSSKSFLFDVNIINNKIYIFHGIRMLNLSLNELKLVVKSRGITGYKSMPEERLLSTLSKSKLVESKSKLAESRSKLVESKNSFDDERLKKIKKILINWEIGF